MSLETKIDELITVTKELVEIQTKVFEGQSNLLAAAKSVTEKNAAGAKAATKPKEEAAGEEAKTETKPAGALTLDDVKATIAGWRTDDEAEKDARQVELKKIIAKVAPSGKLADIPEAKYGAVVKAVKTLIERGDVIKKDEPAADDGDDLLG